MILANNDNFFNKKLIEIANGVVDQDNGRFYPFTVRQVGNPSGSTIALYNSNAGFYVKKVICSYRLIGADTTTQVQLSASLKNVVNIIYKTDVLPSVAQTFTIEYDVGVLCDPGAPLGYTSSVADPAHIVFVVILAEVDAV